MAAQHICIVEEGDARNLREITADGSYAWLHLTDPEPELLDQLAHDLGWHPLVAEDVRKLGQRPKLEGYGDLLFMVVYGAPNAELLAQNREHELVEVAMIVGGSWVVTVVHDPPRGILDLRRDVASGGVHSEDGVVYRILDTVVDGALAVAQSLSEMVGQLELDILSGSPEQIEHLREVRKWVFEIQATAGVQRHIIGEVATALGEVPGLEHSLHHYYRDVLDHAARTEDETLLAREMVSHAFDAYLAMLANRQNDVVKRLTVVSTIFLPLMFVTGFFGQNFDWMVAAIASQTDFAIYGVGGSVLSVLLVVAWMRRSRLW